MKNARFLILVGLVVLGIATRLFPHWPNFTALGATALMAGAFFTDKKWAYIIPVLSLFISDLLINNIVYSQYYDGFVWLSDGFIWIYLGFIANVLIGTSLNTQKIGSVALGALFGALAFFLISNIGAWLSIPLYSKDVVGLIEAYVAGLPFLGNQLMANALYCTILFGAAYASQKQLTPSAIKA